MDNRRAAKGPSIMLGLVLAVVALVQLLAGALLLAQGGSAYYVVSAAGLMAVAAGLMGRWRGTLTVYAALLAGTLGWALWEVGLDAWRLIPRLWAPALLGLVLLLPWWSRGATGLGRQGTGLTSVVGLALPLLAAAPHIVEAWQQGDRANAPFALTDVWHTELTAGVSSLALSDDQQQLFVCTQQGVMARRATTGEPLWAYQWQGDVAGERCAYLAFHDAWQGPVEGAAGVFVPIPGEQEGDPLELASTHEGAGESGISETDLMCPQRLFVASSSGTLLALDADTGRPCESFAAAGMTTVEATSLAALQATDGAIVASAMEDGPALQLLDSGSGESLWSWGDAAGGDRLLAVDQALNRLIVSSAARVPTGDAGSLIQAVDISDGTVLWQTEMLGGITASGTAALMTLTAEEAGLADAGEDAGGREEQPDATALVMVADTAAGLTLFDRLTGEILSHEVLAASPPLAEEPWRNTALTTAGAAERDAWGLTPVDQLWCRLRQRTRDHGLPSALPAPLTDLLADLLVHPPMAPPWSRQTIFGSPDEGSYLLASTGLVSRDGGRLAWPWCQTPPLGAVARVSLGPSTTGEWVSTVAGLDVHHLKPSRFSPRRLMGASGLTAPITIDNTVVVGASSASRLFFLQPDTGQALGTQSLAGGAVEGLWTFTEAPGTSYLVVALKHRQEASRLIVMAPDAMPE